MLDKILKYLPLATFSLTLLSFSIGGVVATFRFFKNRRMRREKDAYERGRKDEEMENLKRQHEHFMVYITRHDDKTSGTGLPPILK